MNVYIRPFFDSFTAGSPGGVGKRILLSFLGVLLLAVGAESASVSDILSNQTQLNAHLTELQKSVETELADIHLDSSEIAQRHDQIAELEKTLSDDMLEWGYTDPEREKYTQTLLEVDTLYSTYSSLTQLQGATSADADEEESLAAFHAQSVDIIASDALRQAIVKASRELELQAFQIQSKTNKLRLDLQEAQQLRQKKQEAESGGAPLVRPRLHALAFENAKLEVSLSWYQLHELKQKYDQEVHRVQKLQKRLDEIQDGIIFPEETLNTRLKQLQDRISDVEKEMETALKRLDAANFSMAQIRVSLGSKPVMPLTPLSSRFLERRAGLNYWENLVTILEEEIKLLKEAQQVWRIRYQLFHDQSSGEEIWSYRDAAQNKIQEMQRQMESARVMEADTLRRIATLRLQLDGASDDIRPHVTQTISQLQRFVPDIVSRQTTLCSDMIFLEQRLYDEASNKLSALRLAEKVGSFSKETVMAFLNTELWNGEGYSVTVSKLVVALLVFLSSFFISSMGSHWIRRWMIRRFKASETAANATQRILFYILWITFVLIALNIVKIPLTAFAFMGGALAVGIGFGMQNIFNNLISGFIVIFSRPFKVNDIISVAGTEGRVHDIGSRSTTIRTWDNLDVVLPNRYFLENNVTNWTGSDMRVRGSLKVGVGYGADSRRVEELLLQVAREHSRVLKNPAPFVRFQDFGDNALMFELFFWVELSHTVSADVASDLRHHLQHVFREEGIDIPYPQQDVHLDPPLTQELMKLLAMFVRASAPAGPATSEPAPADSASSES